MAEFVRYYEILEIAPGASRQAVKQAYRTLARKWHPDRFIDEEEKAIAEAKFKQINLAYEKLKDYQPPSPSATSPTHTQSSRASDQSTPKQSKTPYSRQPPQSQKAPRSPQVPTQGRSPQRLYAMAADYAKQRDYEAAIACLGMAIERQPDYAMAYRYRGHLRSLLALERSAAADLRKADRLERSSVSPPVPKTIEFAQPLKADGILPTPQQQLQQSSPVTALAYRNDMDYLGSGSPSGALLLWDFAAQKLLHQTQAHVGKLTGLLPVSYFGQPGRLFVSAGADGHLCSWRCRSGRIRKVGLYQRHRVSAHRGAVNQIVVRGNRLVSAGSDGLIKHWSIGWRGALRCLQQIPAHSNEITAFDWSPDGDLIISASKEEPTYLWRLSMHVSLGTFPQHAAYATSMQFHPHQPLVAIGEASGWIQLYSLTARSGDISIQQTIPAHSGAVQSIHWISNEQFLTVGADRQIRLWQVGQEQPVAAATAQADLLSTCLMTSDCWISGDAEGRILRHATLTT